MKITPTAIPDVCIVEPVVFGDERGYFYESFNRRVLGQAGIERDFVQDNHSRSRRGVLRGLHYQIPQAQGKLVRVLSGDIYDVAVDLRRSSPSFGRSVGMSLSAENKRMLWVPEGFAHGFLVMSEFAEVFYKTTEYYAPKCERSLLWNDPDLAIAWPECGDPILSERDRHGVRFLQAEVYD